MVCKLDVTPSEYWKMTPYEVNLILDMNRPTHINGIPEDDFDSMLERRQKLIEQGIEVI